MDRYRRQSIRLKDFDYSQDGAYFVTICVNHRKCLFGEINDGAMILNAAGGMIRKWWDKLQEKYPIVEIDEYIIMPNHFHGIIHIIGNKSTVGANPCIRPFNPCIRPFNPCIRPFNPCNRPQKNGINTNQCNKTVRGENTVSPLQGLGRYVSWFKRMTTNAYIRGVYQKKWSIFDKKLWQRNYYERVIRNDIELKQIREYIVENPIKWETDENHPDATKQP